MQIHFIYDPSVSAPAGFTAALNTVAQAASLDFNPITVNVRVGWGEVGGQGWHRGAR